MARFVALHHPGPGNPGWTVRRRACKRACFQGPICPVWNTAHLQQNSMRFCLTSAGSASNVAIEGRFSCRSEAQHNFEARNHDFHCHRPRSRQQGPQAAARTAHRRGGEGPDSRLLEAGHHGHPQPGLDRHLVPGRPADQRSLGLAAEGPGRPGQHDPVLHGKGDHDRVVGLDAGAWAILQLWLDRRAAIGINGHAPVFCTLKGGRVKPAYVRTFLPRLARKAGIDKRVHAHGLATPTPMNLPARARRCTSFNASWASPVGDDGSLYRHLNPAAVVETMKARAWSLWRPRRPAGCPCAGTGPARRQEASTHGHHRRYWQPCGSAGRPIATPNWINGRDRGSGHPAAALPDVDLQAALVRSTWPPTIHDTMRVMYTGVLRVTRRGKLDATLPVRAGRVRHPGHRIAKSFCAVASNRAYHPCSSGHTGPDAVVPSVGWRYAIKLWLARLLTACGRESAPCPRLGKSADVTEVTESSYATERTWRTATASPRHAPAAWRCGVGPGDSAVHQKEGNDGRGRRCKCKVISQQLPPLPRNKQIRPEFILFGKEERLLAILLALALPWKPADRRRHGPDAPPPVP